MSNKLNEFKFLIGKKEKHPTTGVTLEYLDKSNAVSFVLFDENLEKTLLVKQYRSGAKGDTYEICAGLIDNEEEPIKAALRELREETGYDKCDIEEIYELPHGLYVSPGYSTEKLYFFGSKLKSNNIKPKELKLDDGEDLKSEWVEIDNVIEISNDMKTVFAVTFFKNIIK